MQHTSILTETFAMTLLKTAVTSTALLAGGLVASAPQDADAQIRLSFGSGYGYNDYYGGHNHYHGGYSHRPSRAWHDTSHYDYHPGGYTRHRNHYHYQPGHYDFHRSGHYDY